MAYIFFDESGDLGFDFSKKKTSKYFLATFLFAQKKTPVEKIVKKIFQSLNKKKKRGHSGVLHAFKEKPIIRARLLRMLNEKDVNIFCIYLNKGKVYAKLHDEKHVLYNYVVNILLDRIFTKKLLPIDQKIHFIASKRETSVFLNNNFKSYLESQVNQNHKLDISIEIKTPFQEKGLQVVDFVSWALFRKKEHSYESYANYFKSKIIEESSLFG